MKTLATATIDATTQAAVQQFVALVKKHDYPVRQTILYGSRARGDAHDESDADIALIMTGQIQPFIETKLALSALAYNVLLDTGIVVHGLPIWESQWSAPETYVNPSLLHNVKRDGVLF